MLISSAVFEDSCPSLARALGGQTMSLSEEHHNDCENGGMPSDSLREDSEEILYAMVFAGVASSFLGVWRNREVLFSSFNDYISLGIVYLLAIMGAICFGRHFLKIERGIWSLRNIIVLFLCVAIVSSMIALFIVAKKKFIV